jgi:hypothetical protein
MASGQQIAVRGTVIGSYLFRRADKNRRTSRDPWDVAIEGVCPHCGTWQFTHEL